MSAGRACRSRIRKDFRIVGKPTQRLDTPDKVRGTATSRSTSACPGMLAALVAHPPDSAARAKRAADAARAVPGVKNVIEIGSASR
jgi:isoquinoline 1-oxidoreductase beta subunit